MRILTFFSMLVLCACSSTTPKKTVELLIGVNDPLAKKSACDCAWDLANREFEPMIAQIEQETGIKLVFDYHGDASSLAQSVKVGKYDGLVCKTWSGMIWNRDAKRSMERLADLTRKNGKSELSGLFVALTKGPIKTFADINSKKVIMGPHGGYEKHYLAKQTMKQKNINPASIAEAPACMTALIEMHDGNADVAIISDYAMVTSCVSEIFPVEDFKVIGKTTNTTPYVSFYVSEKVPCKVRKNLQKCLLKMKGDNVPEKMNCKGWISPLNWNPAELKK